MRQSAAQKYYYKFQSIYSGQGKIKDFGKIHHYNICNLVFYLGLWYMAGDSMYIC